MNQDTDTRSTRTAAGARSLKAQQDDNSWIKWLLGALAVAALVIIGFFALGGDADLDMDSGDVDVDLPAVDVDVDANAEADATNEDV